MDIQALPHRVDAAALTPEELAGNSHVSEAQKIGTLSQQFEAVLLRQVLRQATQPLIKSSLSDSSAVSGIYQDMVTDHLAEAISQSGSFGLAQTLQEQLTRQLTPAKKN